MKSHLIIQSSNKFITFGLVSTTYMYSLPGFVYKIHVRSCSSSMHLALNPDNGCAQRQIEA